MTQQQHHQDDEYIEEAPASPEVDEGEAEMQGRRLLRIERQLIEQPDGTMRFESRAVYEGDEEEPQAAGAVDLVGLDLQKPAPPGLIWIDCTPNEIARSQWPGDDIGSEALRLTFAKRQGAKIIDSIVAAIRAGRVRAKNPRNFPGWLSVDASKGEILQAAIPISFLQELLDDPDTGAVLEPTIEQPEQPEQPPTVEAPQGATAANPDNSENSGDERQATAAPPDNAHEAAQKPQQPHKEGVPKAEILAVEWPLPDGAPSMESIIKGRPKWASEACIDCGRRGGDSHLWNPALLAVALASREPRKGWTAKPKALTHVIRTSFPEYLEQWESYADSL